MQEEILKSKKYPLRRLKTIAKEKDIIAQKIAFNNLKAKIEKIQLLLQIFNSKKNIFSQKSRLRKDWIGLQQKLTSGLNVAIAIRTT